MATGDPPICNVCGEEFTHDGDDVTGLDDKCAHAEVLRLRVAERDLSHANAILDWTSAALDGEEVSDFAESFPEVRRAIEVRTALAASEQRAEAAEQSAAEWRSGYDGQCVVSDELLRERDEARVKVVEFAREIVNLRAALAASEQRERVAVERGDRLARGIEQSAQDVLEMRARCRSLTTERDEARAEVAEAHAGAAAMRDAVQKLRWNHKTRWIECFHCGSLKNFPNDHMEDCPTEVALKASAAGRALLDENARLRSERDHYRERALVEDPAKMDAEKRRADEAEAECERLRDIAGNETMSAYGKHCRALAAESALDAARWQAFGLAWMAVGWAAFSAKRRDAAEARVRELEAALRKIERDVTASDQLSGDTRSDERRLWDILTRTRAALAGKGETP